MTRYSTLPNPGYKRNYLLVGPLSISGPTRAVTAHTLLEITRRTGVDMIQLIDMLAGTRSFSATSKLITVRQSNGTVTHYSV